MTHQIEAVYDGKVFLPITPITLKADTRVRLSVVYDEASSKPSLLDTARSLRLNGPPDWSERLDEYLYGEKAPEDE